MMFGLVNSITLPKDPTKDDAQTTAMVEIYNRSKDDRDVFSHALFQRGKEPQGFWWEVTTLRPDEPDTTADMMSLWHALPPGATRTQALPVSRGEDVDTTHGFDWLAGKGQS